jgi:hypothetical protein
MKNTKILLKAMGIVSAGMLLFAASANAGSTGAGTQLGVNSQKMAKVSKPSPAPRAPTFGRLAVPDPLKLSGLSPQPEPPDLPTAVVNPTHVAGTTPVPVPPTSQGIIKNPGSLQAFNPQPEPPARRYFMARYLQIQERGDSKAGGLSSNPGTERAATPLPEPPCGAGNLK